MDQYRLEKMVRRVNWCRWKQKKIIRQQNTSGKIRSRYLNPTCFFQSFQAAKSPEPAMVAILTRYSILLDCK